MKVRAETFRLYLKIKRCQCCISWPCFHRYRALLEGHAEELLAGSHALDERIRHLRENDACSIEFGINLHSSNAHDVEFVTPEDFLFQLRVDNQILAGSLRLAQALCRRCHDIVTESLVAVWIDEARRRAAVLMEAPWDD